MVQEEQVHRHKKFWASSFNVTLILVEMHVLGDPPNMPGGSPGAKACSSVLWGAAQKMLAVSGRAVALEKDLKNKARNVGKF